jgi:serine/threonine protein kinase
MPTLSDSEVESLRKLAEDYLRSSGRPYVLHEKLGTGASAAVFEIIEGTTRHALKVYSSDLFRSPGGAAEQRRIKLQESLIGHACPHLVQIHSVANYRGTCLIEMELVEGFDLHTKLKEIPRSAIQSLIAQLVSAVKFLEEKGLTHRDIKPHNIRVSHDCQRLKLLDLGVVRKLDDEDGPDATAQGLRKPFLATAQYSSPEYLFWLHEPSRKLWHALSIYQVGAVLHDLLMQRLLFSDEVATDNRYALAMSVLQKIPSTHASDAPSWLCALAARCLTKDMDRRISMVSWDDFRDAQNRTNDTIRRFQQVRRDGISTSASSGIRAYEQHERRRKIIKDTCEGLQSGIRATFEGSQLEYYEDQISGLDIRAILFRIPNTDLHVDFLIEFRWSSVDKDETATIYSRAQLRSNEVPFAASNPTYPVCSIASDAIDSGVDALLARVVEQVGTALDVAQLNNGKVSGVTSLEKDFI